ncbi:MAG: alpha/beta hydrolase [Microthrixaceae bacterium]|nr:alpha/beta hydrolase [Acidimicrobiales bacterium]MCB9402843.1 alpha/beta hydrolase [Microthrixaceae bacterium]
MALAQTFPLHDGRTLGFDDVGDPGGVAVFFVHGTPDSRRSRHPDDGLATALGIRLVAVDRPGIGLSSPDRGFTVGSFAEDVATLAEALGIDTWATFGWSAGAPFALAMAARHPDRVHRVAVAAGLVPFAAYVTPGILDDADGGRHMVAELGAELGPTATAEMAAPMLAPYPCDLDLAREHVAEGADDKRRADLASVTGAAEAMAVGVVDAVAQGMDGLVREVELQVEDPDVTWQDVRCPVDLWYGGLDGTAPPSFGRWWEGTLTHANLTVDPDAGHLIALTHWRPIMSLLVGT